LFVSEFEIIYKLFDNLSADYNESENNCLNFEIIKFDHLIWHKSQINLHLIHLTNDIKITLLHIHNRKAIFVSHKLIFDNYFTFLFII
jgi:hypothetical protein